MTHMHSTQTVASIWLMLALPIVDIELHSGGLDGITM